MLELDAGTNYSSVKDTGGIEDAVQVRMGKLGTIVFSNDISLTTPAPEVSRISWTDPDILGLVVDQMRSLSREAQLSPSRLGLLDQAAGHLDAYRRTMVASLCAE